MKSLAAVLLLSLLLVALPADGEDEERDARPLTLTVRIHRLEIDGLPPIGLPEGEWTVPTEAEFSKLISELEARPGPETRMTSPLVAGETGRRLSVSLLNRVKYVQDFEEEIPAGTEGPKPIEGTMREGVIADFKTTTSPDGAAVVVSARVTVANLIRPIQEFTTTLGGRKVAIQLPELRVERIRKTVSVPPTGGAIFRAGALTYLVVTAGRVGADKSEPDAGQAPLRPK